MFQINDDVFDPGEDMLVFKILCFIMYVLLLYTILFHKIIKQRACPGFEPGTSRTLSENHTPRPTSHAFTLISDKFNLFLVVVGVIITGRGQ